MTCFQLGFSILCQACMEGQAEIVRLLLEAGANPNEVSAVCSVLTAGGTEGSVVVGVASHTRHVHAAIRPNLIAHGDVAAHGLHARARGRRTDVTCGWC